MFSLPLRLGRGKPPVNEINANSLLHKSNVDSDIAKGLSFLVDCEFTRLTYTNELTCNPDATKPGRLELDGNLLKRIQSGGDELTCRRNYTNEQQLRIMSRLFMNMNDCPDVAPKDALKTSVLFRFPFQFVPRSQMDSDPLPFYRLEDPNIKSDLCSRQDILDAYVYLLLDAYRGEKPTLCRQILVDTSEYLEYLGEESSVLKRRFRFTGNEQDFVTIGRLKDLEGELEVKRLKIKTWLVKIGGVEKNQCYQDGQPQGRGICRVLEVLEVLEVFYSGML